MVIGLLVFFFQAEDGIRDDLVTGVQTCALPISTTTFRFGRRSSPTSSSIQGSKGCRPPRSSSCAWVRGTSLSSNRSCVRYRRCWACTPIRLRYAHKGQRRVESLAYTGAVLPPRNAWFID